MCNHYDIQPMLADEEAFYVFMHARHMYEAVTRQVRQQRGAVTRGAMPDHLVAARREYCEAWWLYVKARQAVELDASVERAERAAGWSTTP